MAKMRVVRVLVLDGEESEVQRQLAQSWLKPEAPQFVGSLHMEEVFRLEVPPEQG